jgi:uncharacterized glyoxalase superfamily protein PhnB
LIGVFDMPRALAFYRDVLGFAVVFASPEVETAEGRFSHFMWLRFGGAEIMLNTQYDSNERPLQPPEKRPKDAVFYIGCSDVELAFQQLADRGLKAERPKVAPYGLKLFSVEDPDGYTNRFSGSAQADRVRSRLSASGRPSILEVVVLYRRRSGGTALEERSESCKQGERSPQIGRVGLQLRLRLPAGEPGK